MGVESKGHNSLRALALSLVGDQSRSGRSELLNLKPPVSQRISGCHVSAQRAGQSTESHMALIGAGGTISSSQPPTSLSVTRQTQTSTEKQSEKFVGDLESFARLRVH